MTFGHVTAECVWYVRGAFSRCRMGLVYAAILKVGDYTQDERQSSRRNKPPELALHPLVPLEERLVALRIPFMQIRELPRGKQLSMRGSVVNVPMDLEPTITSLPRNLDDSARVAVALKKKIVLQLSSISRKCPSECSNESTPLALHQFRVVEKCWYWNKCKVVFTKWFHWSSGFWCFSGDRRLSWPHWCL